MNIDALKTAEKQGIISQIFSIFLLLACITVAAAADDAVSTRITITDSANRSVELSNPVEKIVVINYCAPTEIAALGAADRIVGIDMDTSSKVEKGILPELKDCAVIGSWDNPNYEEIAKLKPDVVISFSAGWPPEPSEIEAKLAPFGINVTGLDFYRMDVWADEMRILGRMLGKETEAEDYIAHFQNEFDLINERTVSLSSDQKKRVYFEGVKDYFTYGGDGFGCGVPGMIRNAGGQDLYPERSEQYFEVNPEDVAKRNPDVIVKLIKEGWGTENYTDFQNLRQQILNRSELASTNAIRNGQVYVVSYDLVGDEGKKFGVLFLAKTLYPDLFADRDPLAFYGDYFKTYLGVDLKGSYIFPSL
jgi:iron complex transport system substrate-binding protein